MSVGTEGDSLNIAVLAPADSPALKNAPPAPAGVRFVYGDSVEAFTADLGEQLIDFHGVLFVPPASPQVLVDLWPAISHSCTWVHSFFAGVDSFGDFFQKYMVHDGKLANHDVSFTNGKGAFSDSLAEYVMAAALHFNKNITRCQANRVDRRWEKFVMPTMRGKTMGFLGFGHIAKQTARVAKSAFGMRIIASRRNPDEQDPLADEVFGQADMAEVRYLCLFCLCSRYLHVTSPFMLLKQSVDFNCVVSVVVAMTGVCTE